MNLAAPNASVDSVHRDSSHHQRMHKSMSLADVLAKHTDSLMKIEGVTGVGEGSKDGKPCIMVFIDHTTEKLRKTIPSVIEGYAVKLEETGAIKAR